jgi:hypothetical protein
MAETNDPNLLAEPAIISGGDDIKAALAKIAAKALRVQTYIDYYDGNHGLLFASEKFRTQFAKRVHKFRDNLCKAVVKAPADRLEVVGFSDDVNSDAYRDSWQIWKYSNMPRLMKRVHREAFKTGDAYIVVWPDADGSARFYIQDPRFCCVFYNPETNRIDYGAKLWRGSNGFVYLTLYYRDRIEKYITRSKQSGGNVPTTAAGFTHRTAPEDEGVWPLPVEGDTCPMFHFGLEGSILDDVIPLNDALNKECADLLIASESNSIQQRWTTGIAYEIDPETGKQIIPWERGSAYVGTSNVEGKFGEFSDASLNAFLEVINDFRAEIATVSGVPSYYFRLESGNLPSGETLRKAETRFTSIIKDAQLDFGEVWANAMRFAMELDDKATGDKVLETAWTPADPMSATELVELALKKKNVGVSEAQNLKEIGYTEADIVRMQDENKQAAAAAADSFGKVFDAGTRAVGGG